MQISDFLIFLFLFLYQKKMIIFDDMMGWHTLYKISVYDKALLSSRWYYFSVR